MASPSRTVLHSDLNHFYAAVECMRNPALRAHPVAVCGRQEDRHGIVLAKNCAAKACGVRTGETVWQAKTKCPGLIITDAHFSEYTKYSRLVQEIYADYSDLIEPFGIDECWIDVTASSRLGNGEQLAHEIRRRVKRELGLTVSVGVSFNKVFAKLGSDMRKPDAVTVIAREQFREKVWPLAVEELLGVGPATAKTLHRYGVRTIGDLAQCPTSLLQYKFGVGGLRLWEYANGEDDTPVVPQCSAPPIKSVGNGVTFNADLTSSEEVWPMLLMLADEVARRLRAAQKKAYGIALSVRTGDLRDRSWQTVLEQPTQHAADLAGGAFSLFCQHYTWSQPVRAMTVRAIHLDDEQAAEQLSLFCDAGKRERDASVDATLDNIRRRFGRRAITHAATLHLPKLPSIAEELRKFAEGSMVSRML